MCFLFSESVILIALTITVAAIFQNSFYGEFYVHLFKKHCNFCPSYHQGIATGFKGCQADAKDYNSGEGVVIDKPSAVGISMATIKGQISVSVAREENRTEIDLECDCLDPAVHTDVSLSCKRGTKQGPSDMCSK